MSVTGYLLVALGFSFAFNMGMFLIAYKQQTDKLTDISYSLTFVALAAYAYKIGDNSWQYSWLILAMVLLWAVRLGGYLLYRVSITGKDKRFDEMRGSFTKFAGFWTLQAATVFVVALGYLTFYKAGYRPDGTALALGIAIWSIGFVIESVADIQKFRFIQNPKNKGKWIDSGIWRYSRHPNYFGEMLVWYGLWVAIASGLSAQNKLIAAISPLFIFTMLMFVSGVPLLEKAADKRWGKQKAYQTYKKQTSLLVPLPKKGQKR